MDRPTEQWSAVGTRSVKPLLRRLNWNCTRLRRKVERKETDDAGETWLMDNWYLVASAKHNAFCALKNAKRLPVLARGDEFRLNAVASEADASDQRALCAYLQRIQSEYPLEERELGLLLPMLQYHALEQMANALDGAHFDSCCQSVISALRTWSGFDFQHIAEEASMIHQIFLEDPSGDYIRMPMEDRAAYRERLAKLAKGEGVEEAAMAREVVARAETGHIGTILFKRPSEPIRLLRQSYYPALFILSLLLSVAGGLALKKPWSILLIWLPVVQILKILADQVLLHFLPRRRIFRLALPDGIPEGAGTLLVKTALLNESGNDEDLAHLERIWLANRDSGVQLSLGLLVDWPESKQPAGERGAQAIQCLGEKMDALNRRYHNQFFLFFRQPVYSEINQSYAGWERKRGALLELARSLRGKGGGIEVRSGDQTRLRSIKYLLTLDSDTEPGVGTVRLLVGAMLHPLNRPALDQKRNVVVSGYGIIQPQIRTQLSSANENPFTRLYSGCAGSDPYRGFGNELLQDLFDEASFSGKGILDIDYFLSCLDGRFPEQRILSHDVLEGAYLRCGTMGQLSFSDRFPSRISAYYKRQHRWARGDWQNLPWIGQRVPVTDGKKAENPITAISRWKLTDNLRRSATPVLQLLCLLLGFLGQRMQVLWCLALLSLLLEPILSCCTGAFFRQMHRRFHARILTVTARAAMTAVVRLLLLPLEAWTNINAITTALWRSYVSHKRMLQWTAAAQTDGLSARFFDAAPGMLLGPVLMLWSRTWTGIILGAFWMLSPVILAALERRDGKPRLKAGERTFLLHEAEQIWDYFFDLMRPERNYLPPDNVQRQPVRTVTERTSPTNVGFAAVSCLAALDLGLAEKETVLALLNGLIDTLERMEKWKGNLYNWYDTVTLCPVAPKVVSSVDSGNLCACLYAVASGLLELGQQQLSERTVALARQMELGSLYDREKRLFFISYDPEHDVWSEAHYDLMASEARLLSYVAVARGEVPRRHWTALSRTQVGSRHYQGMASWSGTMFEYFMPHLLLPAPKYSMLYESLCFCVGEQLRYGQRLGRPWGISESAVPALDQNGMYGYRANGVPALALSGKRPSGYVVSPYSTFLALSILPHRATENLKRLRHGGIYGKYGLYEAAECSGGEVVPVKSWMAHHMGMSLAALDNALRGEILIRRFMAWPEFASCGPLLEESVPFCKADRLNLEQKRGRLEIIRKSGCESKGNHV